MYTGVEDKMEIDEKYMHNKAVSTEWDDCDILVFDEEGHLINIYRHWDLEDMAIDNHNTYLGREKVCTEQ